MSLKSKIYTIVIIGLSVTLFLYLTPSLPSLSDIWLIFIFFLTISAFAEFIYVELPSGSGISIGFPIDFVLILVYGPAPAMLITALGALIAEIIERKISWYKIIFNAAQHALSAGIAGVVYQHTGGIIGFQNFFKFIFPAVLCAFIYPLINLILVNIFISLEKRIKITAVWRINFKDILPSYIAEAPIGFLMAVIYVQTGVLGILIFFLPLLLARRSFELYTKMRKMYLETIRALAAAIDAKDPYTKGHSERVAQLSVALAQDLNLSDRDIENIEYTALLHDIGKIGIDDRILGKSSKLSNEEFKKIKEHPIVGANIIEPVDFLKNSYEAIYHHHERYNGGGYPDGLKEKYIPLCARIIAVADAYDAMGSDRPYRKKLSKEKILKEFIEQSGKQFDPQIVNALMLILKREREE